MAKICPITGEQVVYLVCLECEDKAVCRDLQAESKVKPKSDLKSDLISGLMSGLTADK